MVGIGCAGILFLLVALFSPVYAVAGAVIAFVMWVVNALERPRVDSTANGASAALHTATPQKKAPGALRAHRARRRFRHRRSRTSSSMVSAVEQFYRSQGIWPTDFRCRYQSSCSAGEPAFTPSKASFIGPEYESGRLPRLLFLSLDSGDGSPNPEDHTLDAVRRVELARDVSTLTKTQHWYLTHRFASELLSQFDPSLTVEQMATFFAHVNTAKCSVNRPGRREAPKRLASNCQGYLPGELALLKPDILVTQGARARDAIRSQFTMRDAQEFAVGKATGASGVIDGLADGGTLWLSTHHPSAYGAFWPQQKEIWPAYRKAVGKFLKSRFRRGR